MEIRFTKAEGDELLVIVDLGIYSRTALMKVVHSFTGRCFVHLQDESERRVKVRFRAKQPGQDCSPLAGEFMNSLLDQTLREQIGQETEPVRHLILAHALSNTSLIHPELETIDPTLDPNQVGIPDGKKQVGAA